MPRHFVKMNSLYNVHCITIHVYKSLSPAHRTQLAGLSCPILWSDHPRENIFSIIICIIYLFVCIDQLKGIKKCPDPMLAYTNLAETAQEKSINFFLRWYALIKLMKWSILSAPSAQPHYLACTNWSRPTKRKYKIPKFDNLKFKMMIDVITLGQFGYIILD